MKDISKKRKPRTVQQLKNFSPIAFEIKPIEWSIDDHEEIHELKSLFLFMDDFDLHANLANLPLDIATFVEIDRQKPTDKETVAYLKKVRNKTSQAIRKSLRSPLVWEGACNSSLKPRFTNPAPLRLLGSAPSDLKL